MFTVISSPFVKRSVRLLNRPVNIKYKKEECRGMTNVSNDILNEAEYPPLVDLSKDGIERTEHETLCEEIKRIETVEEKLFKVNMPYYYGWPSVHIQEHVIRHGSLACAKYYTRTYLIPGGNLPSYYERMDADVVEGLAKRIKPFIKDMFTNELRNIPKDDPEENAKYVKLLTRNLNRIILTNAGKTMPHLSTIDIDYDPRLEAFWLVGGVEPPKCIKRIRALAYRTQSKKIVEKPYSKPVQYIGAPLLLTRCSNPLKELVAPDELESIETYVPRFTYDPRCIGFPIKRQHATNIPGHWPRAVPTFGHVSFNSTSHLLQDGRIMKLYPDAIKVQAIFASYGWLHAQACYQGFSTYNDITYPLTSQTIFTNGAEFSFCAYQLNTMYLQDTMPETGGKTNLCWLTEPMEMFELDADNMLKDINDKALETMIKFYANEPTQREGVEMQPYLGESVKRICDIEHDERRIWLEKSFKHLMSKRPRHRLAPQIYHWQKIFHIDNDRRPLQKNREFERMVRPFNRRLDEHLRRYIPKCLRANPKKKKVGRRENTYYP